MTSSQLPAPPPRRGFLAWLKQRWQKILRRQVGSIHRRFYRWYNDTFFPVEAHLTALERAYVERCFSVADWFSEVPQESDYEEYSYFTYSHRIKGDHVNSSRVAFGSVSHPDEMLKAALPVIEERKAEVDPYFLEDDNVYFYGLGWDLEDDHFKVYFRIKDLDQLPQPSLQKLLAETLPEHIRRKEGLVSYTYIDGENFEEKVYAYPRPEAEQYEDIFPGTKGRVLMATSRRGVITQYDVSTTARWREKLNDAGQKLIDTYARRGFTLDTIVMDDADHFTLYFPGAFIPLLGTVTRLRGRGQE